MRPARTPWLQLLQLTLWAGRQRMLAALEAEHARLRRQWGERVIALGPWALPQDMRQVLERQAATIDRLANLSEPEMAGLLHALGEEVPA